MGNYADEIKAELKLQRELLNLNGETILKLQALIDKLEILLEKEGSQNHGLRGGNTST